MNEITEFIKDYLDYIKTNCYGILEEIANTGNISVDMDSDLRSAIEKFKELKKEKT